LKQSRRVDIIIDDKKITSKAKEIELRIDGMKVFSTVNTHNMGKNHIDNLQWTSVKSLLRASDSTFSHIDRFRIVKSLLESPKSFTEVKQLLNTTSATANFHLKTLINGTIVYKEDGRYALTLLGELVLDYFSRFLQEADRLQNMIDLGADDASSNHS
jgi:hypothetical protein